jgi:hypothetical protein
VLLLLLLAGFVAGGGCGVVAAAAAVASVSSALGRSLFMLSLLLLFLSFSFLCVGIVQAKATDTMHDGTRTHKGRT